jgi:hypothetical protein
MAVSRLELTCGAGVDNRFSTVLIDSPNAPKGLAMLIRSETSGIEGEAVATAFSGAIPAASLSMLLLGGLSLLICP